MKMNLAVLVLALSCGVLLAYNGHAQTSVEKFEVAHYRAFCEGIVPKKCLVVMRQGSRDFGTIYDEIENFDFIPGYHYTLKVEVEKVAAPPKDTSGYIYRLREIIARKQIDDPEQDVYLFGTKWRLAKIDGEPVKQEAGAWAVFQGHAGAVYGYGGCNSFQGAFAIKDSEAKVGPLISTTRACLVDWGVEDDLLKALGGGGSFEIEPDRLVVRKEGKATLEFIPYE